MDHDFLIQRHGIVPENILGIRAGGGINPGLCALGFAQAVHSARMLQKFRDDNSYNISYVATSFQERAIQTGDANARVLSIPLIKKIEFNERHFGDLDGLSKEETDAWNAAHPDYVQGEVELHTGYPPCPGSESLEDFEGRLCKGINEEICHRDTQHEHPLMVMHGAGIRVLIAKVFGKKVEVDNAEVFRFQCKSGIWQVNSLMTDQKSFIQDKPYYGPLGHCYTQCA